MNTSHNNIPFSVCMSVYKNDNAEDFLTAIRSISIEQTLAPNEIVLVADGPISEPLQHAIDQFTKEYQHLRYIPLATNHGHAIARQTAIDAATNDWIAIMDSDDIAVPDRFEKQIEFINHHPDVDVLGGQITEFIDNTENIIGKREVPTEDSAIKEYLKSRCPMNFVTVMIRKNALTTVGGIQDWFCEEDYYLWIRMTLNNCIFANLTEVLVNVRSGSNMYQRRGGWRYFQSERGIQVYLLQHHLISIVRYCYNVIGRFVVQVLLPNRLRGFMFQKLFRK